MRNPNCTQCPLHASTTNVCIDGDGPQPARVLLVGEAPGAWEEQQGRPFQGQAGQILNEYLAQAGLSRDEVRVTNAVRCRPPNNRTPTTAEIAACLPYLLAEIEETKPEVIMTLGNTPLSAITGKRTISKERGKTHMPRKGAPIDATIVATYHPAAILHQGGDRIRPAMAEDMQMLKSLLAKAEQSAEAHKSAIFPPEAYDRVTLYGGEDAVRALDWLDKAPVLSCDLEWTANPPRGNKVEMNWPWANKGEIYTVSLTGRIDDRLYSVGLSWPVPPPVYERLKTILTTKPIVFHNGMADGLWLYHVGIEPQFGADTMLLGYLVDERQVLKLEQLASKYCNDVTPGWKGEIRETRPANTSEWERILRYNTYDTFATLRLFEELVAFVKALSPDRRDAIVRLHRHLLLAAVPVLLRAAYIGVPFDEAATKRALAEHKTAKTKAAERLAEIVGVTPLAAQKIAGSSDKTREYLFGALGLDLLNAQKDTLIDYIEYPAVQAILDYKSEQKLVSTYLEPWTVMMKRQRDSRVHTVYRPTGTRTGRISSEAEIGGPLQVTPRERWVRELIHAHDGRLIVAGDYSTVEMRIIAWFANDARLLEVFREGIDIHKVTAAYILACRDGAMDIEEFWPDRDHWIAQVTKDHRQSAKGVNFGLAFGMEEDKLAMYSKNNYGVVMTHTDAHLARESYFRLYSALPLFHSRERQRAITTGLSMVTPFGRVRQIDEADANAAINTPVQSTASDLTLLAMIQTDAMLRREGVDAWVVGSIHDSVLLDVRAEQAEQAGAILKASMEGVDTSVFNFRVPIALPVEIKISEKWS